MRLERCIYFGLMVGCGDSVPATVEVGLPEWVAVGDDLAPKVAVFDADGTPIENPAVEILSSNPNIWQPEFPRVNKAGPLTVRVRVGEVSGEAEVRVREVVEGTWERNSPPFVGMVVTIAPDESGGLVGTIVNRMDPSKLAEVGSSGNPICAANFWAAGTVKLRTFTKISDTEWDAMSGAQRGNCVYRKVLFDNSSRLSVNGDRMRVRGEGGGAGNEQDWVRVEFQPVTYLRRANDITSLATTLSERFQVDVTIGDADANGKLDFVVMADDSPKSVDAVAQVAYEVGAVTGRSDWNSDKVVVRRDSATEPWLVFTTAAARKVTILHPFSDRSGVLKKLGWEP